MPTENYLKIYLILVFLFILAIANPVIAQETATATPTPTETETPTPQAVTMALTIFRDADSLTIFVPRRQEYSSLIGVTLQVTTPTSQIIKRLESDFAAFLGMPFNDLTMLTPICFRLVRNGVNAPAPQACQGTTLNLTEFLFAGDVFWRDAAANQDRLVLLLKDGQPLGVCPPGQTQCEISFVLLLPTSTPTATVTAITEAPTITPIIGPTALPSVTPLTNPTLISTPGGAPTLVPTPTSLADTLVATPTSIGGGPQVVAIVNANVRSGDSNTYPVIGYLSANQIAPIIGISSTSSGWYQIRLPNGREGWVAAAVVLVSGDLRNLPRVQPLSP